jgi:hypothetical protein
MGTAFRMNERGIAGSVRSLDVNIGFDNLEACCRSRTRRRGNSGSHA